MAAKSITLTAEEMEQRIATACRSLSRKKFTEKQLKQFIVNGKVPNETKRTKSGYQLFLDDFRKDLSKEERAKVGQVAKDGAAAWKALDEDDKQPYLDKATKMREAALAANPKKTPKAKKAKSKKTDDSDEDDVDEDDKPKPKKTPKAKKTKAKPKKTEDSDEDDEVDEVEPEVEEEPEEEPEEKPEEEPEEEDKPKKKTPKTKTKKTPKEKKDKKTPKDKKEKKPKKSKK